MQVKWGNRMMSSHRKHEVIGVLKDRFGIAERRVCKILKMVRDYELPLPLRISELACLDRRYGYRHVTAILLDDRWWVNHKRVEQIWSRKA